MLTTQVVCQCLCSYETGNKEYSFMFEDLGRECTDDDYGNHTWLCIVLMVLIPIGIPLGMVLLLLKHKPAILRHEGPHEYESMYISYKPECCLWDTYQMMQKVTLIGLLTFIDRGSILQSLLGLVISAFVLMAMLSSHPYYERRTNVLAVSGQILIVIAYLSAVLLQVDLTGEWFTNDHIGYVMVLSNIPMSVYLLYDGLVTINVELHLARIDLLRAEIGEIGSQYRCTRVGGAPLSRKMIKGIDYKTQECGRIEEDEIVTVNAQAILFEQGGSIARMHKQGNESESGWFSYNHHGLTGTRHFEMVSGDDMLGELVGHLFITFRRSNEQLLTNILRVNWDPSFLIHEIGEVADEDERSQDVWVQVRVNREKQRTMSTRFLEDGDDAKGATWNSGVGQGILFDCTGSDGEAVVESIMLKVFKSAQNNDEPEMLGTCMVDLGDRIMQEEWVWECDGLEPLQIRREVKAVAVERVKVIKEYQPEDHPEDLENLSKDMDMELLHLAIGDTLIVTQKPEGDGEDGLSDFWIGFNQRDGVNGSGLFPRECVALVVDDTTEARPMTKEKTHNPLHSSESDDDSWDEDDDVEGEEQNLYSKWDGSLVTKEQLEPTLDDLADKPLSALTDDEFSRMLALELHGAAIVASLVTDPTFTHAHSQSQKKDEAVEKGGVQSYANPIHNEVTSSEGEELDAMD
jgi:hypothetical protein